MYSSLYKVTTIFACWHSLHPRAGQVARTKTRIHTSSTPSAVLYRLVFENVYFCLTTMMRSSLLVDCNRPASRQQRRECLTYHADVSTSLNVQQRGVLVSPNDQLQS